MVVIKLAHAFIWIIVVVIPVMHAVTQNVPKKAKSDICRKDEILKELQAFRDKFSQQHLVNLDVQNKIAKLTKVIEAQQKTIVDHGKTIETQQKNVNGLKSTIKDYETANSDQKKTVNQLQKTVETQHKDLNDLKSANNDYKTKMNAQENTIDQLQSIITDQQKTMTKCKTSLQRQELSLEILRETVGDLETRINLQPNSSFLKHDLANNQEHAKKEKSTDSQHFSASSKLDALLMGGTPTDTSNGEKMFRSERPRRPNAYSILQSHYNTFGCLNDFLSLSCPDDRRINVTNAHFGQYNYDNPCENGCCAPNPNMDCTELVMTNYPEDWALLQYTCFNKTSCSYEYKGNVINDCEAGYMADYMEIFYSCIPDAVDDAIGFSAYATAPQVYDALDIVIFDGIISNFGGHYNKDSSSFICPYSGVYLFGINFVAYPNYFTVIEIMIDDHGLVAAHDDRYNEHYNHAGATVIAECVSGQRVWAQVISSPAYVYSTSNRFSHFTGYLLHRYNSF